MKEWLQKEYIGRNDEFWGVEFDKENGTSFFKENDFSGTQCTGFACAIRKKVGSGAKIFGFSEKDNPQAGVAKLAGGHDFIVLNDRYIIDPWLVDVESGNITTNTGKRINVNGQGVFDLEDSADSEIIKKVYGDRPKWKRVPLAEMDADSKRPHVTPLNGD